MTDQLKPLAVLNVADTGPLESLVVMLRSVGYECALPDDQIKNRLRRAGHDLVLDVEGLVKGMGYARPMPLPVVGPQVFDPYKWGDTAEPVVFVDLKAQRTYNLIVKEFPTLKDRVLWYRINGGKPEHVIKSDGRDCGDEVNPPCPVLTPNQWYQVTGEQEYQGQDQYGHHTINWPTGWRAGIREGKFYTCWPPFVRFDDYNTRINLDDPMPLGYMPPVCLIHNFKEWGYGALEAPFRKMGLRIYGRGSPDGLVQHGNVKDILRNALCMVHLKSSDAPGYALYEAMAAGCPVVCTRRLIWRCRMQDLLIPGETCLVFDRETHDALTDSDVKICTAEVADHLQALKDVTYNKRIGAAGRNRLREIMWSRDRSEDVESLRQFMKRHFP